MVTMFNVLLVGLLLAVAQAVKAVPSILVYTKTAGYRHAHIPYAISILTSLGLGSLSVPDSAIDPSAKAARWTTMQTEDESMFEDSEWLNRFDALVFLSTTDADPPATATVLTDAGLRNLASYIESGGGYVGIHSASATLFGVPFYGRLCGAFFDYHPELQNVSINVLDGSHPSTSSMPHPWGTREEVYFFRNDPRSLSSSAHVLLTPDPARSFQDPGVNAQGFRNGSNGSPQPLAWWREGGLLDDKGDVGGGVDGGAIRASGGQGRSWYTSLGHMNETWTEDVYRGHVAGGISWVLSSKTTRANNASATVGQASSSSSSSASSVSSSSPSSSATTDSESENESESNAAMVTMAGNTGGSVAALVTALCLGWLSILV